MRRRSDPAAPEWLPDARRFAAMAVAAYLVLLAIAVGWWLFTEEGFTFVREAAVGGAFLDFGVLLPGFVLLQGLRRMVTAPRASVWDQAPGPDEEVPSHPQPPSQEQPPHRTDRDGVPEETPQAHAVSPVSQDLPQGGGPQEHRPPDRSAHRSPRRPVGGLVGWGVILAAGTVWEFVALADPRDDIPTISAVIDVVGAFPVAAWLLLALWVLLGFHLFRPD